MLDNAELAQEGLDAFVVGCSKGRLELQFARATPLTLSPSGLQ